MTTLINEAKYMVAYHEIEGAVRALENGGIILYPTDTLWSIGCDATDPVGVERVCRLKGSKSAEGLELLVDSIQMLKEYVEHLHPKIETLLLYHARPLTVLFDNARNLPDRLIGPDGTIAVRIVQDEFCRHLISETNRPLVATPASTGSSQYPVNFGAISSEIIESVDYVIKYRQNEKTPGEPSVMIRLSERDELEFLRE